MFILIVFTVLTLPVYDLIKDEVGQFAVHVFQVLHVSFPLRWRSGSVAGVMSVTGSCRGSLQTQTWQQSSATHPSETVWCLTPVRRTFRLFGGPVLPLWPAEGVRRGAAAGEGLGGFLGRTFVNVRVSFFLETAPLPTTTNTCSYIHRNITVVWIWQISQNPKQTPTWTQVPIGERQVSVIGAALCWGLWKHIAFVIAEQERETFKRKLQKKTKQNRSCKTCPGYLSPQHTKNKLI